MPLKTLKELQIVLIDNDPNIINSLKLAFLGFKHPTFRFNFTLTGLKDLTSLKDVLFKPDVIFFDNYASDFNGYQGLNQLIKHFPKSAVIVYSKDDDSYAIIEAIQLGAKGYLKKGVSNDELLMAVIKVMEGCLYISPLLIKKIFEVIKFQTYQFSVLTSKENEIVNAINRGLSYKLTGYRLNISINTVREHIKRIYKKLNINSKGELMAMNRTNPEEAPLKFENMA
nr:response regulator transcription factor [Pedobacter sp. ASV2]